MDTFSVDLGKRSRSSASSENRACCSASVNRELASVNSESVTSGAALCDRANEPTSESLLPGENVLVDAVNARSVEVKGHAKAPARAGPRTRS